MAKYIIDGCIFNCCKSSALDIAESYNLQAVYIVGKDNHWRYTPNNGGQWFLASGGYKK